MSNAKKKRVSLRGSKGTIQRVLKLIQPYRGLVLFTLLLAAVTVLTTLYAPILSGRGVDLIVGQGNVNFPALGKIAIQFGVTVCVTSICQWLMNMVNNRITFQVVRDIRVQAFQSSVAVAMCNRTGLEGGMDFAGGSIVTDANGDVIAKAGPGEELLFAEVDMAAPARIRAARPYTSLRRTALYR